VTRVLPTSNRMVEPFTPGSIPADTCHESPAMAGFIRSKALPEVKHLPNISPIRQRFRAT
jgi:hypothetical protein